MRVLVVEDEVFLADAIVEGLRRQGHAVDVAYDGASGLEKASLVPYDVVVLDRDLPLVHGDDVCRELATGETRARVLMVTAAASTADLVHGLGLGADDYIGKPFAFDELSARVLALGRRIERAVPPILRVGDLSIEPAARSVTRAGRQLSLTKKEFAVLEILAARAGQVISAEELLDLAWDEHIDPFTNTVRVTMVGLRRKLGPPPLIDTVTGVGYRLRSIAKC